ncbi:hypothetical protein [Sphingobium cupriresistens]|uniref:Uncharacterized protein n=1 Tax=Sphingobium cupriresistens TaxID=1132417 RepID=A0A8G1ZDC4_9SPHN|nr:hypothetical protein [Sphingobium cupriresistens]RYM07999.1 hypothetical protein EWH12_17850 [Sphingobium cupriresistens]
MKACDFPGSRRIGAPANWDADLDGSVGTIFVVDAVDTLSGMNLMYSVYQPTPEDLAALSAGGAIRLGIMGRSHPVFQLCVLTPERCADAGLKPMWDLGEPV